MFGDDLSKEECDSLMLDLEMCSVPFQCAHGRPSLAPIIDLDKLSSAVADDRPSISMPKLHAVIACMDLDKNLVS
jgi:DNA mismatch repair protein MLH3